MIFYNENNEIKPKIKSFENVKLFKQILKNSFIFAQRDKFWINFDFEQQKQILLQESTVNSFVIKTFIFDE